MTKSNKITIVVAFVWGIVCFLFFQFFYPYHLFHREQMQLFLLDSGYLFSYFEKPAWFACLAGDFLTQFFYYIGGGAITVTAVLLLLIITGYWAIRKICSNWIAFLVILIIATWEAFRNTGVCYPLSSSVALIGGFLIAGIGLSLKVRQTLKVLLNLFLLIIAYWLFGYGMFISLIFIIIGELRGRFKFVALLYFLILILPVLGRSYYLLTISQAYKYPMNSFWNFPDMQKETILAMDIEAGWGNWNKVLEKTQKADLKNKNATYFYNLASNRLNRLPENLMKYYQPGAYGLFLKLSPKSSVQSILFSNEAWFCAGDMTMAEHATMLGQIFSYNHRSSRMVKRLAEINLINGENEATGKYLTMLEHTLCYKKWAKSRRPENQSEALRKWINRKKRFCSSVDTLRINNDVVTSLRNLLNHNPENKAAYDYLLCFHLLTKNIAGFFSDYNTYLKPQGIVPCRLYSEALLIKLAQQNATPEIYASYNLNKSVVNDFWKYTGLYEKSDTEALKKNYKETYWFYYHFATMKERTKLNVQSSKKDD